MDMAELCHVRNDAGDGGHQRRHWGDSGGLQGLEEPLGSGREQQRWLSPGGSMGIPFHFWCLHGWHLHG